MTNIIASGEGVASQPYDLIIESSDAESVEQSSPLLLTFGERLIN